MGVILQLRDGTVKEYVFGQKETSRRMKCGAADCEHIDCNIEYRKAAGKQMKLIMYISPMGTAIMLAALYFFFLAPDDVPLLMSAGVIALLLLMEAAGMILFWWIVRQYEEQVRDLEEFRDRKTVNGIPAEQVHES